MSLTKKLVVIVLIACLGIGILRVGRNTNMQEEENKKMSFYQTETLYLWYTDDIYTDYFTSASVEFHEINPDIRVIPMLVSDSEYLERINEASLSNEDFPDIFMLTNDSLEKAYLAGLASKVKDVGDVLNEDHFSPGALHAVSYRDSYVAYPVSFEGTVLVYNKTYLNDWVENVNAGLVSSFEDGAFMDDEGNIVSDDVDEEEKEMVSLEDYIPRSFDDIRSFADRYEAPDGVEKILEWDVSDVIFNYLFVGRHMNFGGDAGDDINNISILNDNTLVSAKVFQGLHDAFSIDAATSDYNKVVEDFLDGKTVYALASTDIIKTIEDRIEKADEQARLEAEADLLDQPEETDETEEGEEEETVEAPSILDENKIKVYDYGYALIPDVTLDLASRSLSVTNALVINGYSEKKEAANKFGAFLSTEYAPQLYPKTGRLSASLDADYTDPGMVIFQEEYAGSIPLPKMVEVSNLWVQLEIALNDIWAGQDAATRLQNLEDQIKSQVVTE